MKLFKKKVSVNPHGDTRSFSITTKDLVELMSMRGPSAISEFKHLFPGGIKELCELLETDPKKGLSGDEKDLNRRKHFFGVNVIPLKPMKSFFQFVFESIQDTMLIILMIAALASLGLSYYLQRESEDKPEQDEEPVWLEGVAIMMAVVVVVFVTSINDWKKERQFRGLQMKIEDTQHRDVLRNGVIVQLPINDLVVGDICMIKYGDLMAADGVIIDSSDLHVDESSFTGESELAKKSRDKDCFLFSGTYVMDGKAEMIVTAVGVNSQAGSIYTLLAGVSSSGMGIEGKERPFDSHFSNKDHETTKGESKSKEKSVLQAKLTLLAIRIGYLGTLLAVLTVMIMAIRFSIDQFVIGGNEWHSKYIYYYLQFFIIGVTVLVVAVPEGLPLAVTLSLAYSVRRMMYDNNLVRHLDACETMGNATAICSDKTGTLTANRMTVMQIYTAGVFHVDKLPTTPNLPAVILDVLIQGICLNSSYTSKIVISENQSELPLQVGNKTECALLSFLFKFGINYNELRNKHPENTFVKVYTFNSERKYMATVISLSEKPKKYRLLCKGAPEYVLNKCTHVMLENARLETYTSQAAKLADISKQMASMGMRTIAIAFKDIITTGVKSPTEVLMKEPIKWDDPNTIVKELICVAIVGIEDPVRPEVPKAIERCQRAGITVRMLTGDSLETAKSIAYKCGITKHGDDHLILDSTTFNQMIRHKPEYPIDQRLFDKVWPKLRVLARSSPIDKYNLVKGMINSNITPMREVVAVTGDGTNDGPALKIADVGFAMGIAGTDVAKEASDIILMDDNFESLVKAVMWGRNVYDSISKFLQFQLTVNVVAVIICFIGACFINVSPLKAIQMLWVNLIMDTLASLALATERPTAELLNRKPYGRTQPLITHIMLRNIIFHAFYQISIIVAIIRWGDIWFDVDWGFDTVEHHEASTHATIIFNAFVMMTLFNELNSRKLHGQRNVFAGLQKNAIFCSIWLLTMIVQVMIIEFGGNAFDVKKLDLDHWLWCIFIGLGSLLWGQLVVSLPKQTLPKYFSFPYHKKAYNSVTFKKMVSESENPNAILWLRGMAKIANQEESKREFHSGVSLYRASK